MARMWVRLMRHQLSTPKVSVVGGRRFVVGTRTLAGRVTKMAITRFRGPKTRGTFDNRMRNFNLFDSVSRKIC